MYIINYIEVTFTKVYTEVRKACVVGFCALLFQQLGRVCRPLRSMGDAVSDAVASISRLPHLGAASPRVHGASVPVKPLQQFGSASPRKAAQGSLSTSTPPCPLIQTRSQRRPTPRHVLRAERHLWRADVKRWCDTQDRSINWGWDRKQEQELTEWFNALDVDQSGSIEADEIEALMRAMGIEPTQREIARLFESIHKDVDASLSKADFVKFMTANPDLLAGSSFVSSSGALFDANTRLMMLAYRRTRLLDDISDPSKRRNFLSIADFNRAYGGTLGQEEKVARAQIAAPPHLMARPRPLRASPRLPHMRPSPRAPSAMLAPTPAHLVLPPLSSTADTPGAPGVPLGAIGVPIWDEPERNFTPRPAFFRFFNLKVFTYY